MLIASVEPHFRKEFDNLCIRRGVSSTLRQIESPGQYQCFHCGGTIERVNFTGAISGFYDRKYMGHIHYVCYDEIEQSLALKLQDREQLIYNDVSSAIATDQVRDYIHYNPTSGDPLSRRYCSYCDSQLDVSTQQGVCYASTDKDKRDPFGNQYIHTSCYNYICLKGGGLNPIVK